MRLTILYFVYATAMCYCSARVYDGFLFTQTKKQ